MNRIDMSRSAALKGEWAVAEGFGIVFFKDLIDNLAVRKLVGILNKQRIGKTLLYAVCTIHIIARRT